MGGHESIGRLLSDFTLLGWVVALLIAHSSDSFVGHGPARKNFGRASGMLGHVLLVLCKLVHFCRLLVAAPSLPIKAHSEVSHQKWFLLSPRHRITWLRFLLSLAQLHKLNLLLLGQDRRRLLVNFATRLHARTPESLGALIHRRLIHLQRVCLLDELGCGVHRVLGDLLEYNFEFLASRLDMLESATHVDELEVGARDGTRVLFVFLVCEVDPLVVEQHGLLVLPLGCAQKR